MRSTIDSVARIIIPKTIRDRVSLNGGKAIELRVHEGTSLAAPNHE